ncbi:hypothetical protein CMT37_12970 [Elizabethkingia anophelis]|nr:hypothetical protein [Elizabethkingia anophelis]
MKDSTLNALQVGKDRVIKTKRDLLEVMKNWDIKKYGKMPYKKVAEVSGKDKKNCTKILY